MRRSPGWFNPRNSEVWWNCRRSAVSIIDTSGERHNHSVLFGRSLTLHLAVASLERTGQANQPIRRSVEKITSADSALEIEPKRTSSGRNFTTAKFWRTTPTQQGRILRATSAYLFFSETSWCVAECQ